MSIHISFNIFLTETYCNNRYQLLFGFFQSRICHLPHNPCFRNASAYFLLTAEMKQMNAVFRYVRFQIRIYC